MSLFPAYFGARKRPDDDTAPETEPENESRSDIFNLIPPSANDRYAPADAPPAPETPAKPEAAAVPEKAEPRATPSANAMDLSRMSIDNNGQLYWDGKPVEVRRRLAMSRGQIVAVSLIAFFIVVAATGSAIQAAATLNDWACRNGMSTQCAPGPMAPKPAPRPEIPA